MIEQNRRTAWYAYLELRAQREVELRSEQGALLRNAVILPQQVVRSTPSRCWSRTNDCSDDRLPGFWTMRCHSQIAYEMASLQAQLLARNALPALFTVRRTIGLAMSCWPNDPNLALARFLVSLNCVSVMPISARIFSGDSSWR